MIWLAQVRQFFINPVARFGAAFIAFEKQYFSMQT